MDGRCYGLFNVIQMGKDGIVDLKITDYYSVMVIVSKIPMMKRVFNRRRDR